MYKNTLEHNFISIPIISALGAKNRATCQCSCGWYSVLSTIYGSYPSDYPNTFPTKEKAEVGWIKYHINDLPK